MIIGICGLISSGKGTVADILVEEHNFKKISFADALKDGVAVMFGWDRADLEGDTHNSREFRELPDLFWTAETGKTITPRLVLQLVGTECMRNGFYDGIWVSIVKQKLLQDLNANWVIPDTRFPNEINMIHDVGGKTWRVKRGKDPDWFHALRENNIIPIDVHPSEYEWVRSEFDQIIENEDTLQDLKNQILSLL